MVQVEAPVPLNVRESDEVAVGQAARAAKALIAAQPRSSVNRPIDPTDTFDAISIFIIPLLPCEVFPRTSWV